MKALRLTLAVASLVAMVWAPASAQDIQERTIRFGHLNNTDHPASMGVKSSPSSSLPRAAARSR